MRRTTTVLVVEDDTAIRNLILEALKAEGYQADGVADAPAAIEAVGRQRPDLVITDYHLPGDDGLELLRSLRTHGFSDVPALVVSADTRPPDWPATSFIPKPFDLEMILRAVRRALGGSHSEQTEEPPSAREIGPAWSSLFPRQLGLAS